jgi:hypothetical protein
VLGVKGVQCSVMSALKQIRVDYLQINSQLLNQIGITNPLQM